MAEAVSSNHGNLISRDNELAILAEDLDKVKRVRFPKKRNKRS
jgi:hypothetical protein